MWRSTGDIFDTWTSIKSLAQSQIVAQEYNGHGCFNDMDMLVVGMNGNGNVGMQGCTFEEYKLHFSLWALLNSPLMIGCDIRNMTDETKKILMNRDIIAVNQDLGGKQPFFVNSNYTWQINEARKSTEPFYSNYPVENPIIAKYLDNGDIAMGMFNLSDTPLYHNDIVVHFDMLGMPVNSDKEFEITELWSGEITRSSNDIIALGNCEPHTCRIFRARVVNK